MKIELSTKQIIHQKSCKGNIHTHTGNVVFKQILIYNNADLI